MACIWTDDPEYPFYDQCHAAYENDRLAVDTLQKIYDEVWGEGVYKCVGVQSEQVVFGGGNIHCITQQEPKA